MLSALVGADTSTPSAFPLVNVLIVVALVAVTWPLFRRLRRSISANRKKRWIEQGLMDPPASVPRSDDARDQSRE